MTALLLKWVQERREGLMEKWASGGFMGPNIEECAIRNASALGAASILDDLLNISHEDFRNE